MPRKKVTTLRCPACRELVLRDAADFPFCSERCRLIDLGKWASGGYVISSPITDPEEIERVEKAREESGPDGKHGRNLH